MRNWSTVLVLLTLLLICVPAWSQPQDFIPDERFYISVEDEELCVPIVFNRPYDIYQPTVERAVITLPGGSRDAVQMWEWYRSGAYFAETLSTTMLVGLQFLIESDIDFYELENDVAYWDHAGWHIGELSDSTAINPRYARVSSFTFLDSLVAQIASSNPQLEAIVISGASAGAKFVQRYAAVNRVEALLQQLEGPPMVYAPVSNGSFVYVSDHRRSVDGTFSRPDEVMRGFIPQFDRYPYGLQQLNEYAAETGVDAIVGEYNEKHVFYIIGTLDNGPNSDNQPMALQGWNNLQRNVFFYEYVHDTYPDLCNHELVLIPGVGHDADLILINPLAWNPIFYFVPGQ